VVDSNKNPPLLTRLGAVIRLILVKDTSISLVSFTRHTVRIARLSAAEAASGIEHVADLHGVGIQGHREFALRAVLAFHDLTDPQAAVMVWNVRLLSVSRWFDGSKRRGRLVLEGQMVEGRELHTMVVILRTQSGRMRRRGQRRVVWSGRRRVVREGGRWWRGRLR